MENERRVSRHPGIAVSEINLNINEKAIIIDEAVILTKKYCDEEAYKYINGVLDNICVSSQ